MSNIKKNDYQGFELVGDLSFIKNLSAAVEMAQKKTSQSEYINFQHIWQLLKKLGFDYNMYDQLIGMTIAYSRY